MKDKCNSGACKNQQVPSHKTLWNLSVNVNRDVFDQIVLMANQMWASFGKYYCGIEPIVKGES